MYKKILLTIDGSEHALRATDEAVKIATMANDCHIEVVLVAEFGNAKKEVLHATGKEELEVIRRRKLLPALEKIKEKSIPYTIEVLHGEPGPTIVNHANTNDFDLLVIGSRGLNRFQEMVLGSVSHKVMKRANCPVMVVK